jgi:hypothetical protein
MNRSFSSSTLTILSCFTTLTTKTSLRTLNNSLSSSTSSVKLAMSNGSQASVLNASLPAVSSTQFRTPLSTMSALRLTLFVLMANTLSRLSHLLQGWHSTTGSLSYQISNLKTYQRLVGNLAYIEFMTQPDCKGLTLRVVARNDFRRI